MKRKRNGAAVPTERRVLTLVSRATAFAESGPDLWTIDTGLPLWLGLPTLVRCIQSSGIFRVFLGALPGASAMVTGRLLVHVKWVSGPAEIEPGFQLETMPEAGTA